MTPGPENRQPGHGLDDLLTQLNALDGRKVRVTVEEQLGPEAEAQVRKIAWEETQAQVRWNRQRSRMKGRD